MFSNPSESLQLHRVKKFYWDLHAVYVEHGCSGLVDLGDTTDDRTSIGISTLDAVAEGLEAFPFSDYSFKIIGNHEQLMKNGSISTYRFYKPFFKVVPGFEKVHIGGVDTDLLLCSYPSADEDVVKWLYKTRSAKRAVLFGHFKMRGCQMASGTAVDGVDASALSHVKIGLLGHIHKPQTIGKIHYVGSPFQQDFGEAGETKRVAVVDLEKLSVAWVSLPGFPVYTTVSLQEFTARCTEETEDRFKVVLRSVAESEKFYAHPLSKRAVDVVYEFGVAPAGESVAVSSTSEIDIFKRYIELNPPSARAIPLSVDEMVEFGVQIAAAED